MKVPVKADTDMMRALLVRVREVGLTAITSEETLRMISFSSSYPQHELSEEFKELLKQRGRARK